MHKALKIWMELLDFSFMVYAAKVNPFYDFNRQRSCKFCSNNNKILWNFSIDLDVNIPVMRFIIEMMIISQNVHYCPTFTEQLNDLQLSDRVKETVNKFLFNADVSSQSVVNWYESLDNEQTTDEVYATEILYRQLAELFERFNDCDSVKVLASDSRVKCFEYVCKSLETLLKCSDKARAVATNDRFVLSIVEQIEGVYNDMGGGGFKEFVRKSSNDKVSAHFSCATSKYVK